MSRLSFYYKSNLFYAVGLFLYQTIRFKSYLLSLGIDDPVTRDSHGSGDIFHKELAKQISESMEHPIKVWMFRHFVNGYDTIISFKMSNVLVIVKWREPSIYF